MKNVSYMKEKRVKSLAEAVGKRIVSLLEERHMTQYLLCKNGGLSRATVNMIVTGRVQSARIETLYQITATLGISLKEFFDDPMFDDISD